MVPVDTMALRWAVGCCVVTLGMGFGFGTSIALGFAFLSIF